MKLVYNRHLIEKKYYLYIDNGDLDKYFRVYDSEIAELFGITVDEYKNILASYGVITASYDNNITFLIMKMIAEWH